ncbi:MAG TPA: tripartite tricarboxylate transporter substrate-binding protein [Enteractinococcus sp.]
MNKNIGLISLVSIAALTLSACGASDDAAGNGDEAWSPDGTVELVVGAGPGGGSDIMARAFAEEYNEDIVVENLEPVEAEFSVFSDTGNAERIGVGNWASMIAHPSELDTGYKWDDFTQLAIVAADILYLVAAPGAFESAEDLVEQGKQRTLSVAQVGSSGGHQVVAEDIADAMGIDINTIGFDGAGDQLNAVIAGDVDLAILSPGAFMPYVESGDIEPVFSAGSEEYLPEELSDVAVPADLGIDREFPMFWRNFFAPPEIGANEQEHWIDALEEWTQSESYEEFLETNYLAPEFLVGEQLQEQMQTDQTYVD